MCLYPFLRACFKPKSTARYSATLFVAMPTPSRNRQTYQSSELERATLKKTDQKPKSTGYSSVNCIPYFHLQHAAQLLHQLVQDFLSKHHQTEEYRKAGQLGRLSYTSTLCRTRRSGPLLTRKVQRLDQWHCNCLVMLYFVDAKKFCI